VKVVLLGADGQLGTDLRSTAAEAGGVDVLALGRDQLDVTDGDALRTKLGETPFDVIVNCTSYHRTDDAEQHAQLAVDVNAHAVAALAGICAERGARLFHISTDYVFDGRRSTPYLEDDPIGPVNVYGASKALGERLAALAHDDTVVFRVASLFGVAGASGKGGNFVETMIRVGRERGELRVVADQFMSPTATADVARHIVAALREDLPAGTYHLVNSGHASWHEFAARIIDLVELDVAVRPLSTAEYPLPARRPAYSVLDNGKIAARLGPLPHWDDALQRYLRAKGHR
jgi:dTDP-4-dehydrorhamnose reductase